MPSSSAFAPIALVYDLLLSEARIARERPALEDFLGDALRVCDLGCGTGRHLASLAADRALQGVGIDADPLSSREHILIANILQHSWQLGRDLDIARLIGEIQDDGQFSIVSETPGTVPGDAWSDYLPESAKLIADWRKPMECGNFNVETGACGGAAN